MLEFPPNYATVTMQIAIFVVLWVALKRLWFGPALRVIHERRARSEGALREARALQAEAEELRAAHASALEAARRETHREVEAIVRGAEAEQKRLIAEARDDAQRTLAEVRSRVAEDVASARQELRSQAVTIASDIARKVLGRTP